MNKIVYIVVLLISGVLFSQEKDKNLYNGNQSFAQKITPMPKQIIV